MAEPPKYTRLFKYLLAHYKVAPCLPALWLREELCRERAGSPGLSAGSPGLSARTAGQRAPLASCLPTRSGELIEKLIPDLRLRGSPSECFDCCGVGTDAGEHAASHPSG